MDAGDECPLDDPKKMVAWWERNMKHRVPEGIWNAAGSEEMVEIPKVHQVIKVPVAPVVEEIPTIGFGLEAEIDRLEKLAGMLGAVAAEPGKTKPYLDTIARLTKLTADLRVEAEKQGRLLPRDMVETAIHSFHGPIEREIRLMYRTMCEVLGIPPSPEREAKWHAEADRMFARFQSELFAA